MNSDEAWTPETIKGLVMGALPTMQRIGATMPEIVPEGTAPADAAIALVALGTVLLKQGGTSFENYLELVATLYQRSVIMGEPLADA